MRLVTCALILLPILSIWPTGRSQVHQPSRAREWKASTPASRNQYGRIGKLSSFVPTGYEVYMQKKADLNLDGRPDILLILAPKNEAQIYEEADGEVEEQHRLLLLLTGTANKKFQLQIRNANVAYHYGYDNNFLDCFEDLTLKRGQFTIAHLGGRGVPWYRATTFTYRPATATWQLSADTEDTFDVTSPEEPHTENLLKHRISLSHFNIYLR